LAFPNQDHHPDRPHPPDLIIGLGGVPNQDRIGFWYWRDGKAFNPYKKTGDLGAFLGIVNVNGIVNVKRARLWIVCVYRDGVDRG